MDKMTPAQIEDLYDEGGFRLYQERNDFFLPQIVDFIKDKKWMNIRPEYQRRLVWDNKKKSRFIESLLMNVPVPPIFLYENDLNRYEVMDGQQRLNTIVEFYDNRLRLSGLEEWSPLNGMKYEDFPARIRRGLDRRRLSASVVLAERGRDEAHGKKIRHYVFERLNTGGVVLRAQELRNCVYTGSFNKLIIELAGLDLFNDLLGMPRYSKCIRGSTITKELAENKYFKRMDDCEMVLRFFAFREKGNIKNSTKAMLDRCMDEYQNIEEDKIKMFRELFVTRLDLANQLFGDKAFKHHGDFMLVIYDGVMIALDRLFDRRTELISKSSKILEKIAGLLGDKDTHDQLLERISSAKSVKYRIDLFENAFRTCING